MQIRKELKIWMVIFLSLYLIMTFGMIHLLSRMAPAIEHILQENVYSITAVETMLIAAADRSDPNRNHHFVTALEKARNNITEAEEEIVINQIAQQWQQALSGNDTAMSELVRLLHQLGQINRESMQEADEQAKQLGSAGTWTAAMLGFSGFLISLYAIRRLSRRFLGPLEEIHGALQAFQQGEKLRRCTLQQSSPEFREVGEAVNQLLETQWSKSEETIRNRTQLDRAALLHLIDAQTAPMVILDSAGQIHAANVAMESMLNGETGATMRAIFLNIASSSADLPKGIQVEKLKTGGWFCRWPLPGGHL